MSAADFLAAWLWGCMMHCPDDRWDLIDPDVRVSALMLLRPSRGGVRVL